MKAKVSTVKGKTGGESTNSGGTAGFWSLSIAHFMGPSQKAQYGGV